MTEQELTPFNPYSLMIKDLIKRGYSMIDIASALQVTRQAMYDLLKKPYVYRVNSKLYLALVDLHKSMKDADKLPKRKRRASNLP
jgi:predicted DNA-binding protein YlxM (UPF0122 family)